MAKLVKNLPCSVGDLGLILGLGRSSGEGKEYPLQNSGLENSMDCIPYEVTKSQTQLSEFHFHFLSKNAMFWKINYMIFIHLQDVVRH